MTKHSVVDAGDLRKYYAAIPNLVFKLGLKPFELALYAHFKQAAGDDGGVCWKSRATIAKEAGMSSGMVTKARQALEVPRVELGGRPLIVVKDEASKSGGKPTCVVTITDIWALNMSKFSPSPHDVATSPHDIEAVAPSPHDEQRHTVTLATSPHGHKEELLKKNPEEVIPAFWNSLKTDPAYAHVDFNFELARMRSWLTRNKGRRFTERFVIRWLDKVDRPVEFPIQPISGNGTDRAAIEARAAKDAELARRQGYGI